ncbi:hypothetical protein [Pseudomonas putida]|uniref:hypothetical protein n=1 Tax=Pseudomonas putida TaxID=303 RepID=UPI000A7B4B22|nr:hypothetical protein [Pseudomonas putida]
MPNPTPTWQLFSFALAAALIATLVQLHRSNTARHPEKRTRPTVSKSQNLEHLALSPSAHRVHERYSL